MKIIIFSVLGGLCISLIAAPLFANSWRMPVRFVGVGDGLSVGQVICITGLQRAALRDADLKRAARIALAGEDQRRLRYSSGFSVNGHLKLRP